MMEIGSWVTQYRKGFWQVVDIKPKYAEEDYTFENGKSQKKGELIGLWVLMKKGFTPKMKYKLDFDVCDSLWCKEVTGDIVDDINSYFKDHPDDYLAFSKAQYIDQPAVSTSWLHLTPEQEILFRQVIQMLPSRFTRDQAMKIFKENGLEKCFSLPPAKHRFVCWHTLWELDENFNPTYKNPSLEDDSDAIPSKRLMK